MKRSTITALTLALVAGLGGAAIGVATSGGPDAPTATAAAPAPTRTQVVTKTIHRVRHVRDHPRTTVAPAAPVAVPAAPAPAPAAVPVAAAPAPAPTAEPVSDDAYEHERGQHADGDGERHDD